MDTFTRDGLTFDATDSGPADGELVLLLHGFPQDQHAYDDVVARLNDAGLRTLTFDQRGYSPRARPAGRAAYAMHELIADAAAAIDASGASRAHVVGHDWGGAVAWGIAEHVPSKVASVTVLSTPHPDAMMKAMRKGDQARKSWYMGLFQVPVVAERVVLRTLPKTLSEIPAPLRERYIARFQTPADLTGPLNWYRAMGAGVVREAAGALRAKRGGAPTRSAGVRVPATYVWGRRDFALGRDAAEDTASFVSGEYEFVELDAGHWLPEVNPDAVAEAILKRIRSTH